MFKIISPFVLAYKLENNSGHGFTVESIRSDADGDIRLLLRNNVTNVPHSTILANILNWKIVSDNQNKTVLDHLESCFAEAHKWIGKIDIGRLRRQKEGGINFLQMPYCVNWDGLLHLSNELTDERHPEQRFFQLLEEDRQRWCAQDGPTTQNDTEKFFVKLPDLPNSLSHVAHVQAAIRVAKRILAIVPDVSDPDAVLEGYAIAATEEHCHLYIRESLEHIHSKRGSQPDIHLTYVVSIDSIEPVIGAKNNNVILEKCSDVRVQIKIPYTALSKDRLVVVKIRNVLNNFDLYRDLKTEAKAKNSIFVETIARLKKSLCSLQRIGWLRFKSHNEVAQWVNSNLIATNPELAHSLAVALRWLKSDCRNLQEAERENAKEIVVVKIRELIPQVTPSYPKSSIPKKEEI